MIKFPELSIYIHIPFCSRKCAYCDFYSISNYNDYLVDLLLSEIIRDTEIFFSEFAPENVRTVFIGGGTPSVIDPEMLHDFINSITAFTGRVEEFTIEANPESISRGFLEAASSAGVNRLSMGVQSYRVETLEWLGRKAGSESINNAERLIRKFWNGSVSKDIITSVPFTSTENDILCALKDNPDHISVYELTVEKNTPLYSDAGALSLIPDSDTAYNEWQRSVELLETKGYHRYEISNFSKKNKQSLHNLAYWRMNPYLGLGPSAVSTLPDGKGSAIRIEQPRSINKWLDKSHAAEEKNTLKAEELILEHYIMGLRISEGLSKERFSAVFGADPAELIGETYRKWSSAGALESSHDSLKPTGYGMDILNSILSDAAAELSETIPSGIHTKWPFRKAESL